MLVCEDGGVLFPYVNVFLNIHRRFLTTLERHKRCKANALGLCCCHIARTVVAAVTDLGNAEDEVLLGYTTEDEATTNTLSLILAKAVPLLDCNETHMYYQSRVYRLCSCPCSKCVDEATVRTIGTPGWLICFGVRFERPVIQPLESHQFCERKHKALIIEVWMWSHAVCVETEFGETTEEAARSSEDQ